LREVSLIAARGADGSVVRFPLIENTHHEGILRLSLVPAVTPDDPLEAAADQIAAQVLAAFDYVGVLTVECFVVAGATGTQLCINEFAPRVHNSGHWSIEGATESQFGLHVRAVCGLPLPHPRLHGAAGMLNLIGSEPASGMVPLEVAVHRYHKAPRPGRKVGHLTVVATDPTEVLRGIARCKELAGVWFPPAVVS
jgi:5-(carboxyamino)imidazole ribonucleotide synthase